MRLKLTTEEFIKRAKTVHGDTYSYELVDYKYAREKVFIICNRCNNQFKQTPDKHLQGNGCRNCCNLLTTTEFINKAKEVHNNKYDYGLVKYVGSAHKIIILCNNCINKFTQLAGMHLQGQGCPKCNVHTKSKKESKLLNTLSKHFHVISQYKPDWLRVTKTNPLSFDIYLPEYNIVVEYQGRQHFHPIKYYGGNETFGRILKRDELKKNLAEANKCKVLYFTYTKNDVPKKYINQVYFDETELINNIKNG